MYKFYTLILFWCLFTENISCNSISAEKAETDSSFQRLIDRTDKLIVLLEENFQILQKYQQMTDQSIRCPSYFILVIKIALVLVLLILPILTYVYLEKLSGALNSVYF